MSLDRGRPVLITGGAGFIGTNLADRLLSSGHRVLVYDNLFREGVSENLAWLRERHGSLVEAHIADVRDTLLLRRAVRRASAVFHFAAQVAVTSSLTDPVEDFEVNARGTLNVLEAIRAMSEPPPLLFTSTNKVYGNLSRVGLTLRDGRYLPEDPTLRQRGVGEDSPLDFHSPYGCSKGAADQYVLDYARVYGLPAVVFRMSCIYGPHQRGTEDQGWVAHFVLRALAEAPITIYGDGHQVRDALYAEDLVDAMTTAVDHIDHLAGRAFNIGGGPANAVSVQELLAILRELHGRLPPICHGAWRPADQRFYVSCLDSFMEAVGWRPRVSVAEGVERLYRHFRARRPADGRAVPAAGAPAAAARH
jgi:CDP-paratose 2-epimerase